MSADRIFSTTGAPISATAATTRLASGIASDLAIGTPSAREEIGRAALVEAVDAARPRAHRATRATARPARARAAASGAAGRAPSPRRRIRDGGRPARRPPSAAPATSPPTASAPRRRAWPMRAKRSSGSTASSGLNWAEEPTTKITASLPSSASSRSMVPATISGLAPARVRSTSLPSPAAMPSGFSQSTSACGGSAMSRPAIAMLSTTMAAPPPVVVATATRLPACRRRDRPAAPARRSAIRTSTRGRCRGGGRRRRRWRRNRRWRRCATSPAPGRSSERPSL